MKLPFLLFWKDVFYNLEILVLSSKSNITILANKFFQNDIE